jgi:hypothetical protein
MVLGTLVYNKPRAIDGKQQNSHVYLDNIFGIPYSLQKDHVNIINDSNPQERIRLSGYGFPVSVVLLCVHVASIIYKGRVELDHYVLLPSLCVQF